MKTAKRIRNIEEWEADASVYKLSTPVEYKVLSTGEKRSTEYVIASSVNVPVAGEETLVFSCDEKGEAVGMLEITAIRGLSHKEALADLGYKIVA